MQCIVGADRILYKTANEYMAVVYVGNGPVCTGTNNVPNTFT